ncbi:MAG: hypothetical protein JNN26_04110 [Candidatus Obscuribacter sp.]|nr:hypothetical protein [Candidatus Obscuribacter sp.]
MNHEKLENHDQSAKRQDTLSSLHDEYFSINGNLMGARSFDKNLQVSGDGQSLSFGTQDLYGDASKRSVPNHGASSGGSESLFDDLNITKNKNSGRDVLTSEEVTEGAYKLLVQANSNGNDMLDKKEWMNVASVFGFNQEQASNVYDLGWQKYQQGESAQDVVRELITPQVMSAADINRSGGIDRREFDLWTAKPTSISGLEGSQSEFDSLNREKNGQPARDVLSQTEITKSAHDFLISTNTNGNDIIDKQEWLKVAGGFGFNQEQASIAYNLGWQKYQQGESMMDIVKELITPRVLSSLDTNQSGGIDRGEFERGFLA